MNNMGYKILAIILISVILLQAGQAAAQFGFPKPPFVIPVKIDRISGANAEITIHNTKTLTTVISYTDSNGELIYDWANTRDPYPDEGTVFLIKTGDETKTAAVYGGILPLIRFESIQIPEPGPIPTYSLPPQVTPLPEVVTNTVTVYKYVCDDGSIRDNAPECQKGVQKEDLTGLLALVALILGGIGGAGSVRIYYSRRSDKKWSGRRRIF